MVLKDAQFLPSSSLSNGSERFGERRGLGRDSYRAIDWIETPTRFIRWASCNLRDARLRTVTIRQRDRFREIRDEVTRNVLAQDRAQGYQTGGQQQVASFRAERRNCFGCCQRKEQSRGRIGRIHLEAGYRDDSLLGRRTRVCQQSRFKR